MNRSSTFWALCLTASLGVLAPDAEARSDKNIKMTFEINQGSVELKTGLLSTTRSNCRREDHPGCYNLDPDEVGKFKLKLKGGDAECGDADAWRIHSVVLGGESPVDSPSPKPSAWGRISANAAADFDADMNTGVVDTTEDGDDKVLFEDQNNHELSIWYKVVFEQCGSGDQLEYDPRIENRG